MHDLYSFILGAYVMVILSKAINSVARGSDYYFKRHEHGGWLFLLGKARTHLRQKVLIVSGNSGKKTISSNQHQLCIVICLICAFFYSYFFFLLGMQIYLFDIDNWVDDSVTCRCGH